MRVAIPLFGEDVAPRLCSADRLLVADLEGGAVVSRRVLHPARPGEPERLELLGAHGVGWLVCGGIGRCHLALAERLGVKVVWGVYGEAEAALADFAQGRPLRRLSGPRRVRARGRS